MICGGCAHDNVNGMRFCTDCGQPLQTVEASASESITAAPGPTTELGTTATSAHAAPAVPSVPPVPPAPPAPAATPSRGGRPGIIAQLVAVAIAFLVWIFSDKRRALVAGGAVAVVLLGNWWWSSRPASRESICGQATALEQELQSSTGAFDNKAFSLANSLGDAAVKADSGDGGDVTAVHYAGQQLQGLGKGSGVIQVASEYEFEAPLATIENWCATTAIAVANQAPVQDTPTPQDTPTIADSPTNTATDTGVAGGIGAALVCTAINDEVLGTAGTSLVYNGQTGPGADNPSGLQQQNNCLYDFANATSSVPPFAVSLYSFDTVDDAVGLLATINQPDPGEGQTATFPFQGDQAAIARVGTALVMVTADPSTHLTNDQLTTIALTTAKYLRPA